VADEIQVVLNRSRAAIVCDTPNQRGAAPKETKPCQPGEAIETFQNLTEFPDPFMLARQSPDAPYLPLESQSRCFA